MTRPGIRRAAACLATGVVTGLVVAATAGPVAALPADDEDAPPLEVTIEQLSPSTLPDAEKPNGKPNTRDVTVSGVVTNSSEDEWTGLRAYLLTSESPITSKADLAEANATDPTTVIGERLIADGQYVEVPDLEPGESAPYELAVPRDELAITGAPGVYWLGVHVLGASPEGQDAVADGRARTFIPLIEPATPGTTLSLVMPLKGFTLRDRTGRLVDTDRLTKSFKRRGRLGGLLRLSKNTDVPLTFVLDPSLVDAADSLADGNPPRDTGTHLDGSGDGSGAQPSEDPSTSGTAEPSDVASDGASDGASDSVGDSGGDPGDPETDEGKDDEPTAGERAARAWVQELQRQAGDHTVLTVPYGDLDVAATLGRDNPGLYRQAVELSARTMRHFDIDAEPVVAPSSGYLPLTALAQIQDTVAVLLTDAAVPHATADVLGPYAGSDPDGDQESPPVVLTDSAAASGGPAPGAPTSAIALRQRILSEAALHALSPRRDDPLVVSTPQRWNPGPQVSRARFFRGLDVPWLRLVDLPGVLSLTGGTGESPTSDAVVYPEGQQDAEVPFLNLFGSKELSADGRVLAGLLARNDTVDDEVGKQAMLSSSSPARLHPRRAAALTRSATNEIQSMLGKVHVDGPSFVTMSSQSGTFSVTIVNDLDETVDVAVTADTGDDPVTIADSDPITLGPGQRASVRLQASSEQIGVYTATLIPVNANGEPLGSIDRVSLRSSQVGFVIWVIMGIGGVVLLAAIVVRILRQVSRRKKTHGPVLKGSGG